MVHLENRDDNAANDIETINFSGNVVERIDFKGYSFYYQNDGGSDTHPNEIEKATINDNYFIGSSTYENNVDASSIYWLEDDDANATGAVLEIKRNFFSRTNDGIYLRNQNNAVIEGNTFYDMGYFSGTSMSQTNPLAIWNNDSDATIIKDNVWVQENTLAKGVSLYIDAESTGVIVTGNVMYHTNPKDVANRTRLIHGVTGGSYTGTNNTYLNVENVSDTDNPWLVGGANKSLATYAESDDVSFSNLTKSTTTSTIVRNHMTKPLGL
jgi:parallel beta-helix repeat protein